MPTLAKDEILGFVLTTLNQEMNVPLDADSATDDLPIGAGGIDLESLSLVELTLRIERQFEVTIPDSDIESIGAMTLGELIADIARRKAAA
jgi:acyl carrier protein